MTDFCMFDLSVQSDQFRFYDMYEIITRTGSSDYSRTNRRKVADELRKQGMKTIRMYGEYGFRLKYLWCINDLDSGLMDHAGFYLRSIWKVYDCNPSNVLSEPYVDIYEILENSGYKGGNTDRGMFSGYSAKFLKHLAIEYLDKLGFPCAGCNSFRMRLLNNGL